MAPFLGDYMFKVLENISLSEGVVTLDENQAKTRLHNLKSLGNNAYEILKTVMFKKGESIGFSGNIDRLLAAKLEEIENIDEVEIDNSISEVEELIVEENEIPEVNEYPKAIGKGWYELPGGKRVRGLESAIEALNGLQ